jgi:hypothetical protein
MNLLGRASLLCIVACPPALLAQMTFPPVLAQPSHIRYPPIAARAAHVEGDEVVGFSINSDGHTNSIQSISGPAMLTSSVEQEIKQWTFKIPLPITAQHDFIATYKFRLHIDENLDDDLDGPPYTPCCDDIDVLPASAMQVTGDVRSSTGAQTIDVSPAPPEPPKDSCPDDKDKRPPSATAFSDFVELYRTSCARTCNIYRYASIATAASNGMAERLSRSKGTSPRSYCPKLRQVC